MVKFNLIVGALFGLLAVAAGAAGGHLVEEILNKEFRDRGDAAMALEARAASAPDVDEEEPADPDGPAPEDADPAAEEPANDTDSPADETPDDDDGDDGEDADDEEAEPADDDEAIAGQVTVAARPSYAAEREERMEQYHTATRYQMYHALAMVALGGMLLASSRGAMVGLIAGVLFTVGHFLFSGSLYLISVYNMQELTWIVPIGGISFIAGWAFFLLAAVQAEPRDFDD